MTHELIHPDYVLFVDEVGNNTNMRDDGQIGGTKYLGVVKGQSAKLTSSCADARWTLLGFTNGNGEPILCAIIFASETISAADKLGINVFAPMFEPCDNIKINSGPGKLFPGAPTCFYKGKEVPAFVSCSSKGSITSELLAEMLRWIDLHEVFDRHPKGPLPFLLLDGHGSRLEMPFLDYINSAENNGKHKWIVCLGLPNGTSLWQVGDSSQQNGCYKMYCNKQKMNICKYKRDHNIRNTNLEKTDIVPIVNYAWKQSFAKVESNKKAIRERGWKPLNRMLLVHDEVVKSEQKHDDSPSFEFSLSSISSEGETSVSISPKDLNFKYGKGNEVMTDIVQHFHKDEQSMKTLKKRKVDGQKLTNKINAAKRLTAGVLFNAGHITMDEEVLDIVAKKNDKRNSDAMDKAIKIFKEFNDRERKINDFKNKKILEKSSFAMTGAQLKILLQWKKRKGDSAVPKSVEKQRERWVSIKNRPEQTITEHLNDRSVFENYKHDTKGKEITLEELKLYYHATLLPSPGVPDSNDVDFGAV